VTPITQDWSWSSDDSLSNEYAFLGAKIYMNTFEYTYIEVCFYGHWCY